MIVNLKQKIVQSLDKVREVSPLVHNITNVVVTNFTANELLALGAALTYYGVAAEQAVQE